MSDASSFQFFNILRCVEKLKGEYILENIVYAEIPFQENDFDTFEIKF